MLYLRKEEFMVHWGGSDSQVVLTMQLRIPQILPHVRKEDMHLLRRPAQELRVQPERKGLEAFFDLDEVPATDVFLFLLVSASPLPPPDSCGRGGCLPNACPSPTAQ